MKNILIFALILAFPVTSAMAVRPQGATPPGGWGTDDTDWIVYADPWASGELIYDPLQGAGGEGWMDCATGQQVVWPALDIEMWIEMECILTWDRTWAKIHRFSNYNPFYLYFNGTSACNNGQWIITTPPTALGSLANLPFVEDMFGRTTGYGTDIPLTWEYSVDGSAYALMIDGTGGNKQFEVGLCDHYFTVRILVEVVYHQEDGYYWLGGPGCTICPATPL